MHCTLAFEGRSYSLKLANSHSLAPLMHFGPEKQASAFGAPAATSTPLQAGSFIGDTRQGGSCNAAVLQICPHGNGAHTESAAHLNADAPSIGMQLQQALIPCILISITPQSAALLTTETYHAKQPEDLMISAADLSEALSAYTPAQSEALIIRTLPNNSNKARRDWENAPPCYLSTEAVKFITKHGVQHLLLDLPSLDRPDDGGCLGNHRIFWQDNTHKTISEMLYIPEHIPDGFYLLNLQIPAFASDAAPCRPLLIPLELIH